MGGDTLPFPASSSSDDDELSTIKHQSLEANERRIKRVYEQVYKSYDESKNRAVNIDLAKTKILSYTPGAWIENIGGMNVSDYNVPKTTTLLLIGPKGSGKSSLVNRISRVFEDDKFAPERAQVTYNSSVRDGTSFLHEYMIPRTSTSFCLYDACGISNDLSENLEMIERWMTKGVCHGESVKSVSEGPSLNSGMKLNARKHKLPSYQRRIVNFVIFVVDGLSVLKCIDNNGVDTQYTQMVAKLCSSPFLCFKDHKPAIAITHGDLLSLSERVRVRVYLGELLGVHPSKQTFDIPDDCEPATELTIVDLIRYGLEHADRNLPCKVRPNFKKGSTIQLWSYLLLLFGLGMFISTFHIQRFHSPKLYTENGSVSKPQIKVTEVFPEKVSKASSEIKKVTEVYPENIPKAKPEIKKVKEVFPKNNPESKPKMKKVMEVVSESVSESTPKIKEVMEDFSENISKATPKIKKVAEVFPEKIPEATPEIKKFTEVFPENMSEAKPKIKKVMEVFPENIPPETRRELKKVLPENNCRPSIDKNKVETERIREKSQKIKKVRVGKRVHEPEMKIDWNKIRHIW